MHIDPAFDDAERRRRLFAGDVVVYTGVPEVAAFAAFTRTLVAEALHPDEPTAVHTRRDPAALADLLIDFKPRFIHHPESIAHVRRIVEALGGRAETTHADVPKLRTAFPAGGLSTGIAYAFQPHRDTWYAAPGAQVNWWLPVWPVAQDNVMEFFPRGFATDVPNTSEDYNYYQANAWRGRIKDFSGGTDVRVHPAPRVPLPDDEPRLTVVPPVGGVMLFSGDQLHASVPNTSGRTRYSIDFRTVDAADVREGRGAPCVDVACAGTALRDFRRLSDGAGFTEDDVAPHDTPGAGAVTGGVTVYAPG
ncbi:MAG: hypothetical protein ACT4RN_19890 [Pseudonocardia sp.]